MAAFQIEFQNGVHLPELGLWLDACDPKFGPEKVFISHAHSDHVEEHREMIVSAPTAKLIQARTGAKSFQHILPFREPAEFTNGENRFCLTLLPAGHIFGSAMSLIECAGKKLLYTGDFKLRRGLSAETCEPARADILIMETTFGRPQYQFPPAADVIKNVIRFCRESLDNDETPVLLGYSLGKSQEILCGLAEAGLPLMLHGAVFKLTQIYEQFGQCFPKYERYDSGSARGKVLLAPPNVSNSAMLRRLGKTRTAILTGWAVDPNCRYRYQCDAAFPLSDHADFPDLIEMVKRVQPKKIYTLHGFAADFARTLRELGFDAQALSQNEQFELALGESKSRATPFVIEKSPREKSRESSEIHEPCGDSAHSFIRFAETCAAISGTTSKLEKIRLLAEYFRCLKGDPVSIAATWFSGRPFASGQNKVMQLGWAILRDALCSIAEMDAATFHQIYLKHSDLGETAFEILEARETKPTLAIEQVNEIFHKLHAARGPLAKRPILASALARCSALEAKFLVKIITGDLRIGLKEGLVEESIASAFEKSADEIRQTHLLVGDIGETAKLASENKLGDAALVPFRPVRFMLASPEETAADIWERVASAQAPDRESTQARRQDADGAFVWIEDKYDGVRCQLHKVGGRVALYSRDLKEITATFPELADSARDVRADLILDGEIVAMRGDEVLPFAELQKRLGRREGDLFMREEVPIQFVAFDLLWLNGENFLNRPLRERRRTLASLHSFPKNFRLARITETNSAGEIEAAFSAARARGNEGLMIKNPASVYTPGRRGLAWLKLKKALATLDCVVVGAEFGHGKRAKVLSDYTFAVRDENSGELKTIGKAYSGLTDAEIARLTEHFLKKAIRRRGRYFEVEPDTVLEIAFDKIQPSARHNSGLAMRFPRIARIRTDKSNAEIDTLANARKLVK
ncbi:MAG TPA: ATP-dependent DNA ligase [Verrucomicrobiae bacterium]|nr:ATP-dependent DNA ligase [Verrucomicrobiae bacterium]